MTLTGNNSTNYIEDTSEDEKKVERYMSESGGKECDESNNKYIYIVGFVTLAMILFSQGPFYSLSKYQLLNGFIYIVLISLVLKVIYEFQNNYEPYNILNPMRHKNKDSDEIDLDSTVSIEATAIGIFTSICLLLLFKKYFH